MLQSSNQIATIILQILDKVRTLCKECSLPGLPIKLATSDLLSLFQNNSITLPLPLSPSSLSTNQNNNILSNLNTYTSALDELRNKIYDYRQLQEEYKKLQQMLQKNETQIRKHIGVEQQFKLYVDTIKSQYEESENERIQLFENSKIMIKQLKAESQSLREKLKQLEESRDPALITVKQSKKTLNLHRHKDRIKSQYCTSQVVNHHRHYTENPFISPIKEKLKAQDFKIELTDRGENSKKKKGGNQIKKKHNYTVLAYIGHKKRQSKERNHLKKTLFALSHKKKIGFDIDIKQQNLRGNREKCISNKNVHRSVLSLGSIDSAQE